MIDRIIKGSFAIERHYPKSVEIVFAAWSNPKVKALWFIGPEPWQRIRHDLDFRVGGEECLHGRFADGNDTIYRARFHDIQINARIMSVYDMHWNNAHRSTSLCAVEVWAEANGTRLRYSEQIMFLDGTDGTESRRLGTLDHLERIALVL